MKPNELREMSVDDLPAKLDELTDERFRLRFRSATESIENPDALPGDPARHRADQDGPARAGRSRPRGNR